MTAPSPTIGIISLGCAKNLVDSENMAGLLLEAGATLLPPAAHHQADAILINTCSFIGDAKQESIDTILELVHARDKRRHNKQQKIIVAGCLPQRHSAELAKAIPEIDALIGINEVPLIAQILQSLLSTKPNTGSSTQLIQTTPRPTWLPDDRTPRFQLTAPHTAYLKIAEGCNHPCAFCAIPQIRGRHRSRPIKTILAEARRLIKNGVKEINLISQDTTYYGMDTWTERPNPRSPVDSSKGHALSTLLKKLNALKGDFWIRLLYTHPAHWSDELVQTYATCEKLVPYIDIPLQHISDHMLSLMRRETSSAHIRQLIQKLRRQLPHAAIRTTFIVGFPGETKADFDELCQFVSETKFDRLGVFRYSKEQNTRAAKLPRQVPEKTKQQRWQTLMALQRKIATNAARQKIGHKIRLLVDAPGLARSSHDAPDIDTRVHIPNTHKTGTFTTLAPTASKSYDLIVRPRKTPKTKE